MIISDLTILLLVSAIIQAVIAILNLCLVRLMRWKGEIEKLPLLVREVFHVHSFFISMTVTIFAVMTWRFAPEMSMGLSPATTWLACAIGIFWGIRSVIQWAYYGRSHWWGQTGPTLIHVALTFVYGGMTFVYLLAAAR